MPYCCCCCCTSPRCALCIFTQPVGAKISHTPLRRRCVYICGECLKAGRRWRGGGVETASSPTEGGTSPAVTQKARHGFCLSSSLCFFSSPAPPPRRRMDLPKFSPDSRSPAAGGSIGRVY